MAEKLCSEKGVGATSEDDPKTSKVESTLWMHANVVAQIPDNAIAFATTGGSLLSAAIDGTLDVSCSAAKCSVPVPTRRVVSDDGEASDSPQEKVAQVAVPLSTRWYKTDAGVVHVDRRMQVMAALNVGAVTSAGAACDAHAGFGCASFAAALETGVALVGLRYSKWDSLVGSVALAQVRLMDGPDPSRASVVSHRIVVDKAAEAMLKGAADHFVRYVEGASHVRSNERVYPRAPNLSKSFTSAPKGYTTIDSIVHINTGLSSEQLNDVLGGMVRTAIAEGVPMQVGAKDGAPTDGGGDGDDDPHARRVEKEARLMLRETATPGAKASAWRWVAARAIHHAVRTATDYHVDGIVTLGADARTRFEEAESWLPFAQRNFLKESNDCDGSCSLAMRMARQIGLSPYGDSRYDKTTGAFHSVDPTFVPERDVWVKAVRNALSHTDTLLFTIVGASTGEGTKVTTHEPETPETPDGAGATGISDRPQAPEGSPPLDQRAAVASELPPAAGHAVALLVPSVDLLVATKRGGDARRTDALHAARHAALYPPGKIAALPPDEREAYADPKAILSRPRAISPLALDGTVTSSMEISVGGEERRSAAQRAARTSALAVRLGPVMASRVVDLTSVGKNGEHAFYLHMVEATIPAAFGDSPNLRAFGEAAYQYVFAPVHPRDGRPVAGLAGASPSDIHSGQYALVPLHRVDVTCGRAVDAIREETLMHTLPMRDPTAFADDIDASEHANAAVSRRALSDLDSVLRARQRAHGTELPVNAFAELHITPRMMWGNPKSVSQTAQKIAAVAEWGRVDFREFGSLSDDASLAVVKIWT